MLAQLKQLEILALKQVSTSNEKAVYLMKKITSKGEGKVALEILGITPL